MSDDKPAQRRVLYSLTRDSIYYIAARDYLEWQGIAGSYFLIESANWHRLKESDPEKAEQIALEAYMKKAQSEL